MYIKHISLCGPKQTVTSERPWHFTSADLTLLQLNSVRSLLFINSSRCVLKCVLKWVLKCVLKCTRRKLKPTTLHNVLCAWAWWFTVARLLSVIPRTKIGTNYSTELRPTVFLLFALYYNKRAETECVKNNIANTKERVNIELVYCLLYSIVHNIMVNYNNLLIPSDIH